MSSHYKKRRQSLETLILLIDRIENDIRVFNCPVYEIITNCQNVRPFERLEFLKHFPNNNCDYKKYDCFAQEDIDYIVPFFSLLGASDCETEINICENYKHLLTVNLEDARKKEKEKPKMIKSLSIVVSLAAVILVI